jgi:D-alanyl-D-alanine carboxypeptidase (penicillin-binding protein 5/6)
MARRDQWSSGARGGPYGRRRSRGRRVGRVLLVVVVVVVVLGAVQLLRGVPQPSYDAMLSTATVPGRTPSVPWPSQGEAAAEIVGVGNLGTYGSQSPQVIASVTKMMTALVLIHDHPLSLGEQGPSITITPQDYQIYLADKAANDSVMAVAPGEQLSEYQALEALLIPSADNMATVLAIWDAGSVKAFVAKMNAEAKKLGLTDTHYADPSGLSAGTYSNAISQLKVARLVMDNPVLAGIVAQPQATLPVAGVVYNVNGEVTHHGIIGVKTGSILTGNFAMACAIHVAGRTYTGLGVVLDQGGVAPLETALHAGERLAVFEEQLLRPVTVVREGQELGALAVPGGAQVPVVASRGVTLVGWPGLLVSVSVRLDHHLYGVRAGSVIGTATVSLGEQRVEVPLRVVATVQRPPLLWRLTQL